MNHTIYMQRAIEEAKIAAQNGDVPVGAVIVYKDEIIATARNEVEKKQDASAHAELLALQVASQKLGQRILPECCLYVTLEPCTMCIGAILLFRIKELYFGCTDPEQGAVGSLFDLSSHQELPHKVRVYHGLLEKECAQMLKDFFKKCRK